MRLTILRFLCIVLFLLIFQNNLFSDPQTNFSANDLLKMKYISEIALSPDGNSIAYIQRVPRAATDKPGNPYYQLFVMSLKEKQPKPFITGKVSVKSIAWKPDGSGISFLSKFGENEKTQVWFIPVSGGESYPITYFPQNISAYQWFNSGKEICFLAQTPDSKHAKELREKGYNFIYYEENLKTSNLYIQKLVDFGKFASEQQITFDLNVWDFNVSDITNQIAYSASPKNLIDQKYMYRQIYIYSRKFNKSKQLTNFDGKLGNYVFSPDGKNLAYTAASKRMDHAVSSVYWLPTNGGDVKDLTPDNFKGHITWVNWKNNEKLVYLANVGVQKSLTEVNLTGDKRKILYQSQDYGLIPDHFVFSTDFKFGLFLGETPYHPDEVYLWKPGNTPEQLTQSNNWINDRKFGEQKIIQYSARDGIKIEGLLIYPVDYQEGQQYPLIVIVHGGPESNYSNGWMTYYSRPGQIMAGKDYLVFYPNYRASTGYGFDYAMKWHYNNPAGTEFDDVADGIDYLVEQGLADKDRVGLAGGSYGGYAAAWFGTYYTEKVKAVCMFVGISDLISKRGTTDIPYEELYVHSGKKLEDMWDLSLKRSPIYWAHQSKSAFLILGGAADPRVHPSQSLEMYRRLKMNDHPAVRLVQYPGEGHGNSKQPGRIDVLYRMMDWFDWYVRDKKPLDGSMPPLDISSKYGVDFSK